jgi:hypothetical protein
LFYKQTAPTERGSIFWDVCFINGRLGGDFQKIILS